MKGINLLVMTLSLLTLVSCSETHFKEDKFYAGGVYAPMKALNDGKSTYTEFCMPCHGVKGDGLGISAKGLAVPPRNFTLGLYKFGNVVSGELPHDEDFYRIIKSGLHGTGMLPWDLSPQQLFNVTQYIKSFAPQKWEGADKKLGDVIALTKNPYGEAHLESAITRGREVYHVVAQCWTCHRAYVSKEEFSKMNLKINNKPVTEFDPDMYHVKLQPSDHGYIVMPPDYTWDSVRSALTVDDLYIRLNAGVGGTTMPSWKGTLPDEDIWAVAHYIKSLMDLKNSPERQKLMDQIKL